VNKKITTPEEAREAIREVTNSLRDLLEAIDNGYEPTQDELVVLLSTLLNLDESVSRMQDHIQTLLQQRKYPS
jgi:cell division protein ZapA (FtsZ GTPase activity inhibitor)